ncbi:MAG: hypothetical protein ACXADW_16725 [Candidatus Hodarchaeales archaeon]
MYIDPYAWLYWKDAFITGMTTNPGYTFLTVHTICLVIIAAYCIKNWRRKK